MSSGIASATWAARSWRAETRDALEQALESGYSIHGFELDTPARRGYYLLSR